MGKESILHRFLGVDSDSIELLEELPEETTSLRRSDFPLHVVLKNGEEMIVLLEIQTVFRQRFVLTLIDYVVRFKLKYNIEVIPLVLALTYSSQATGYYQDNWLAFRYNVVRLWEKKAIEYLDEMWLYPFVPLMDGGEKILEEMENKIYKDQEISIEKKGDLLTAMAIFTGLKDKDLAVQLIRRRRDIMIQSIAYDIIKEEGKVEGKVEGKIEGKIEGLYEAISLGLEIKFGIDSLVLMEKVQKINSIEKLEEIKEAIRVARKVEEIKEML